jgi:acetyltransferase
MNRIAEMLSPQSVALIGASEKENSVGRAVLTNLLAGGKRPLYPIHPNRKSVLGLTCYASIRDVHEQIGLAVVVTPAHTVPAIVRECGEAGVAGAIILSAGFGDADPHGKELKNEIIDLRRSYGIRIIGPNCLGVILPHVGLNATFLTSNPRPGRIALISRALGDAILDWGGAMGIGFSMFASLGSMIDVGYGELLDFLHDDYNTKSMMICMENVGDAKRFISAARSFALSKPLVVLKPGRSKIGAGFIAERKEGVAGDDRVYDAVFKRIGAVRVRELSDLFNLAEVLDSRYLPRGPRLAIITNAGDVGSMATDALAEFGGSLASIHGGTKGSPDLFLPEQWSRDDPIDMVGEEDTRRYLNTVKACLDDEGVDGILVIYTPRAAGASNLAQALVEISQKTAKPVIVTCTGGERAAADRLILLQNDVPAYATPEEAVKTYLYMYSYRRNIDLLYETPAETTQIRTPLKNHLKTILRNAVKAQRHTLNTEHSLDFLKNYQIETLRTAVVRDPAEVRAGVAGIGLPLSLTIRHLVANKEAQVIDVVTDEDIGRVCQEVKKQFGRDGRCDEGDVEIILREVPASGTHRLKLQSRRDPEFHTLVVLSPGMAGPDDVCIGLPPLNQTLARRLIEGTGIYRALKDNDAGQQVLARLEDVLVGFSNLVVDFPEIDCIDILLWVGQSDLLAGEVKIVPSRNHDDSAPYPNLVIAPYPSHYMTTWSLPDGTEALVRPVRPEDEPMVREMVATLSEETMRTRFFTPLEITHDLLIRSCNIDYEREIAIVAEIKKDGKRRVIGGSRLIHEPDTRIAQFAILVHDDYQRLGLGARLIDILIGIAQEKKLDEIYGLVLSENRKMLALCEKLGFEIKLEPDGVSRVRLSLKD